MENTVNQIRNAAMSKGRSIRDKARSEALKRKQEYLGARVPKELRDKVIARASELDIPVSILIRKILEGAFQEGSENVASQSTVQKNEVAGLDSVIGWEDITLNKTMPCSLCHTQMDAGTKVTLGMALPGHDHLVLCNKCKESL